MATYLERFNLVRNTEFTSRIQMALWVKAAEVLNDSGANAGEKQFALKVLKGVADGDRMMILAVICTANAAIGAAGMAATDGDIQFVVNANFSRLAA